MPMNDTVVGLLRDSYGSLPGPGIYSYDAAERFSAQLSANGVNAVGVIGLACSRQGWFYVAFSPSLARDIQRKWAPPNHQALGDLFRRIFADEAAGRRVKLWICPDRTNPAVGNVNRGCAEKKIISQVHLHGDSILEMSIFAHPNAEASEELTSYASVGSADGTFIVPCESCKTAAQALLNH